MNTFLKQWFFYKEGTFYQCNLVISVIDHATKNPTELAAATHLYKRSCPSVRRSVGPYVPYHFRTTNSSNKVRINDTMSDEETVATDVPSLYLFFTSFSLHCNTHTDIPN